MKKNLCSEKVLERRLVREIKARKGLCIKLLSTFFKGLPDRMCLLPGGRIYFVEVKSENEKPSPFQLFVHRQLRDLGFIVLVIDKDSQLTEFLRSL